MNCDPFFEKFVDEAYDEYEPVCDSVDTYHCADMLTGVIECVFQSGDIDKLKDCLEELAAELDVKFPTTEPVLEKKNTNRLMHWYLGYQRAQIENMKENTI